MSDTFHRICLLPGDGIGPEITAEAVKVLGVLGERWGVTFIVGLKNDDLIKNQQTIVCEARLALAIRRPSAFVNADIVTP